MAELVAKRYSNALFSIAIDENKVDSLLEDVTGILEVFNSNQDFTAIMNHPQITSHEKSELLKNTFENHVDSDIIGLFEIVLKKNRATELVSILENFIDLAKKHQNISKAVITTATPLSEVQANKIVTILSEKLGKTINYEVEIDENLIGGLKVAIDGKVFENTVQKTLTDLKKDFYK
ncbi:MAG: F0F1 ATP synthase subunit delta [Lachnospirales bacterium]